MSTKNKRIFNYRKTKGQAKLLVFFLCLLLALTALPTYAQNNPDSIIRLSTIEVLDFPSLQLAFRISNPSKVFSNTLSRDQIKIIENGKSITPTELNSAYTGVHFIAVIEKNPALKTRYVDGSNNFEKFVSSLENIGSRLLVGSGDLYSLFFSETIQSVQLENYEKWIRQLQETYDQLTDPVSNLEALYQAIVWMEANPSAQERVLFYLSTYMEDEALNAELINLLDRAAGMGVQVHPWIMTAPNVVGSAYESMLSQAAQATGGKLLLLTGSEILPDLNELFSGLGYTYSLTYQSPSRTSGQNQVSLQITSPENMILESNLSTYEINIEAPELSFINLPEQLSLYILEDQSVSPETLPVDILIDFPDNLAREIIFTSFWVNGLLLNENFQPPFGSFSLDLSDYLDRSSISLQIKIEDEYGYTSQTESKRIALNVLNPPDPEKTPWYNSLWFLALVAGLTLILSSFMLYSIKHKRSKKLESSSESQEKPAKTDAVSSLKPFTAQAPPNMIFGSLIKLDHDNTPSAEKPILLTREIILIGSDPELAQLILKDPAVEPLHAELHFYHNGQIKLTDFNSTAGTYVNFKPVSVHGSELNHGDIIHIGSSTFRLQSRTRVGKPLATENKSPKDLL